MQMRPAAPPQGPIGLLADAVASGSQEVRIPRIEGSRHGLQVLMRWKTPYLHVGLRKEKMVMVHLARSKECPIDCSASGSLQKAGTCREGSTRTW